MTKYEISILNIINETKDIITATLIKFHDSLKETKTVRGKCTALYDFLWKLEL